MMIDYDNAISITPYKELHDGDESIHKHTQDGYAVPNKVIIYLQTTVPFMMSPGIYNHPFKIGTVFWVRIGIPMENIIGTEILGNMFLNIILFCRRIL